MLVNDEKIQGVDLKTVFTKMLSEVPWNALRAYVLGNVQLNRLCTAGGFRLEPNRRSRVEGFILRDAEKNNYSEIFCNGIFAQWYPVHTEIHQALEDYFHSEAYKKLREERQLKEDDYVLEDDKFHSLFKVEDFETWRILLCFSPLKFTPEQAKEILEDRKNDVDLMTRLQEAESQRDELSRKVAQLTAEAERLRAKQQADNGEIQELRKQSRQFKNDAEQAQKRADALLAEVRRANQNATNAEAGASQREDAVRDELNRVISRQQSEMEQLRKDLAAWMARHEEQCNINRGLTERADAADKRTAEAELLRNDAETKLEESHHLVDSLLKNIDWLKVGTAMKPNPTVKRNFNSLVRRLDYDANRNLTIEGTLQAFWGRLTRNERDLVEAIAKSTDRELASGSVLGYWEHLKDQFADVLINLEARHAMLGMLQEIFFQNYSTDELEGSASKTAKTKKKAADE